MVAPFGNQNGRLRPTFENHKEIQFFTKLTVVTFLASLHAFGDSSSSLVKTKGTSYPLHHRVVAITIRQYKTPATLRRWRFGCDQLMDVSHGKGQRIHLDGIWSNHPHLLEFRSIPTCRVVWRFHKASSFSHFLTMNRWVFHDFHFFFDTRKVLETTSRLFRSVETIFDGWTDTCWISGKRRTVACERTSEPLSDVRLKISRDQVSRFQCFRLQIARVVSINLPLNLPARAFS